MGEATPRHAGKRDRSVSEHGASPSALKKQALVISSGGGLSSGDVASNLIIPAAAASVSRGSRARMPLRASRSSGVPGGAASSSAAAQIKGPQVFH